MKKYTILIFFLFRVLKIEYQSKNQVVNYDRNKSLVRCNVTTYYIKLSYMSKDDYNTLNNLVLKRTYY